MGCGGSKASAAKPACALAQNTLLASPAEKAVDNAAPLEPFSIFIDSVAVDSACLQATYDDTMLKVVEVQGGAIGLWNNRPRTTKVKIDDLVLQVRRVGGEWFANDSGLMLKALQTQGPFEVVVKRPPFDFSIFIDSNADCLTATADGTMLQVLNIQGGAIGLWNNRPRTLKVHQDDLVLKVRKAGVNSGEWIANDSVLMLETLQATGPFEVLVTRPMFEEKLPAATKEVKPAKSSTVDTSTPVEAALPESKKVPAEEPAASNTSDPAGEVEEGAPLAVVDAEEVVPSGKALVCGIFSCSS